MTAHEVLVSARNLIEREGWGQGLAGFTEAPDRCVVGALEVAAAGRWEDRSPAEAVFNAVVCAPVSFWNDTPGRTKEEVLAAFDEAIRRTAPPPKDPFPNGVEQMEVV